MTTVAPGDDVPSAPIHVMREGRPQRVDSREMLGSGRVVLFAVPGAFTPGCATQHLPGFLDRADELADHHVDRVACLSMNDAWVMEAWADAHGVGDRIVMLADGNGAFTRAMGMETSLPGIGLGIRSQRYAAVIVDGRVTHLGLDEDGQVADSSCEAVLRHLEEEAT